MMPIRYTIIVPVWGAVHVTRFLDWALPTWLSPRNLPELATRAHVELVVLTLREDVELIKQHPMFLLLRSYCEVRFVEIDDLAAGGISTVTLTLAFTRGANLALSDEPFPRLVFLNGDFLLSDGSLSSVADRFEDGHSLLLCASVRVREELASHDFIRMRRSDGVMILPSRDAVKTALRALHPTVLACRVDQPLLQSAHPNQFFWQPNSSTLILRSFLLSPLAVAPQRLPGPADTYCDYGWIGQMAGDASPYIIDDTDELFIAELSPTSQEIEFVRAGPVKIEDCASRMSQWMTEFSSAQATTPIIFKAADFRDAGVVEALASSRKFVDEVRKRFGPFRPVHNHPYWLGGVAAFVRNRRNLGIDDLPLEMSVQAEVKSSEFALRSRLRELGKALLVGEPGRRRPWHPYWRADQIIARLGPLEALGRASILGKLGLIRSLEGTPIDAVDLENSQAVAAAVTKVAEAVKEGQRAYLIVGHDIQAVSHRLSIGERLVVLNAIEREFRIVSVASLVNLAEAETASRHLRFAIDMQLVGPLGVLRLAFGSMVSLIKLGLMNLQRLALDEEIGSSVVLLLELRRAMSSRQKL